MPTWPLFTVGPVTPHPWVLERLAEPPIYNRTAGFSKVLAKATALIQAILASDANVAFLTSSGTHAMTRLLAQWIQPSEQVGVITGGTFGERWLSLAQQLGATSIALEPNGLQALSPRSIPENLDGLILTHVETSTLVKHPAQALASEMKRRGAWVVVDAIGSAAVEPDLPREADAIVLTSGKGLALPPGLAMVAMQDDAIQRLGPAALNTEDLRLAFSEAARDQTPFTPAIGLIQVLSDLHDLAPSHPAHPQGAHAAAKARSQQFRLDATTLGLEIAPTEAVGGTCVLLSNENEARQTVEALAQAGFFVAPNAHRSVARGFRVGHMGHQPAEAAQALQNALKTTLTQKSG